MTTEESKDLARFARQAMPKSNQAQEIVLASAILPFEKQSTAEVIADYAAEHEFISTVEILNMIRDRTGPVAYERWKRLAIEADRKREELKVTQDPSVTQALDFCRSTDPAQLAAWRAEIEGESPFLARQWHGKETGDNVAIAAVIYSRYGRIPRECWAGGRA